MFTSSDFFDSLVVDTAGSRRHTLARTQRKHSVNCERILPKYEIGRALRRTHILVDEPYVVAPFTRTDTDDSAPV